MSGAAQGKRGRDDEKKGGKEPGERRGAMAKTTEEPVVAGSQSRMKTTSGQARTRTHRHTDTQRAHLRSIVRVDWVGEKHRHAEREASRFSHIALGRREPVWVAVGSVFVSLQRLRTRRFE